MGSLHILPIRGYLRETLTDLKSVIEQSLPQAPAVDDRILFVPTHFHTRLPIHCGKQSIRGFLKEKAEQSVIEDSALELFHSNIALVGDLNCRLQLKDEHGVRKETYFHAIEFRVLQGFRMENPTPGRKPFLLFEVEKLGRKVKATVAPSVLEFDTEDELRDAFGDRKDELSEKYFEPASKKKSNSNLQQFASIVTPPPICFQYCVRLDIFSVAGVEEICRFFQHQSCEH